MRVLLRFVLLLSLLNLVACSALFGRDGYFRDRGDEYLKAVEIPPMKVPENLDAGAISELFVIPPINNEFVDQEKEFETPRSSFGSVQEKAQVKIQTLDRRRWILVNSSPTTVWPRLKHFLEENQLPVSREDPGSGQIETVWLVLKDEAGVKDRYRLTVEQGLHVGTTEVHVLQITMPATTPGQGGINWPSHSVNPDREKWMVDKLAGYLAQDDAGVVSLLAQSIGRTQKVSFVQPYQGESFILIMLDKERVLASVGGALNNLPFAVEDINRSAGTILASYDPAYQGGAEAEEKPGFFARLFGLDKKKERERNQRLLHYRVQCEELARDEVRVLVRNQQGEPLVSAERDRLLQKIRQNLL